MFTEKSVHFIITSHKWNSKIEWFVVYNLVDILIILLEPVDYRAVASPTLHSDFSSFFSVHLFFTFYMRVFRVFFFRAFRFLTFSMSFFVHFFLLFSPPKKSCIFSFFFCVFHAIFNLACVFKRVCAFKKTIECGSQRTRTAMDKPELNEIKTLSLDVVFLFKIKKRL